MNPLWVVHWNADKPRLPQTWEKSGCTWSFWQYSSKGRVEGIQDDVDLDWANKTLAR